LFTLAGTLGLVAAALTLRIRAPERAPVPIARTTTSPALRHDAVLWLSTATAVGVRIGLGGLSDRIGRRRVLLPAMAVFAVSILALGAVRSIPALVVVGLVFGAGQGMTYPTANALMVDLSHAGNLGRVQTLFSGSFSVGVAASAFVFGRVIARSGYPAMFTWAAACVAAGIVLLWIAPERVVDADVDVIAETLAR